ncbi:uncharacterized protein LOC6569548 [Drosophila grimshawi]|uniref:GH17716 n=1 Tax=Drosophila grimshawi TaxID=7222 RepID=B4JWP9_DROGR|nr:uncharacterized protein LOC6569548 [Drosophila grimshawi]EDV95175.1 GH17716 [Drosophila grimshawi]
MDHHTYAKSGSKKWSVEEKRLLVTKRIEAEDLFSKYSSKQAEPWKKFKDMAKIGDYSERALRKQWLNMVQRYRVQKSTMQVTLLSKQCIDVLNEEWEYFGEIHAYMNQKTTDLHSYALKEPNVLPEHSNNNNSNGSGNNNLAMLGVVNDHSFCASTRAAKSELSAPAVVIKEEVDSLDVSDEGQQESVDFGDIIISQPNNEFNTVAGEGSQSTMYSDSESEESSQPSDPVTVEVSDLSEVDAIMGSPLSAKFAADVCEASTAEQIPASFETASVSMPRDEQTAAKSWARWTARLATLVEQTTAPTKPMKRKRKAMSERDKYYRHRRRYEHRMELRLGNLCKVAGQLLEHLVPGMNVTPLLMNINNNVDYNCTSSCDDGDDDTEDDDDNDDKDGQQ